MEISIQPEPGPDERAALEAAAARLVEPPEPPASYVSAWRRAGVAENLEIE